METREVYHINANKIPVMNDPSAVKKIAAYCRVSHDNDDQYGSLESQVTYYTNLINETPMWENVGVYSEAGSGRSIAKRKEFKKLLAKCRKKKVDMIITKSISRFSRNTLDMLEVCFELRLLGVEVFFQKENMKLSSPDTLMHLEILSSFAQEEIRSRSQDIKLGVKHSFANGTSGYINFTCYGYQKGKNGLEINKKEAKVVVTIFDLRLKGYSLGGISKVLQKKKIPSPTGKEIWSRETLNKLLKNEKVCGNVILQKTYVEDYLQGNQIKNKGEMARYMVKNNHTPIISTELFNAVNLKQ